MNQSTDASKGLKELIMTANNQYLRSNWIQIATFNTRNSLRLSDAYMHQ